MWRDERAEGRGAPPPKIPVDLQASNQLTLVPPTAVIQTIMFSLIHHDNGISFLFTR